MWTLIQPFTGITKIKEQYETSGASSVIVTVAKTNRFYVKGDQLTVLRRDVFTTFTQSKHGTITGTTL